MARITIRLPSILLDSLLGLALAGRGGSDGDAGASGEVGVGAVLDDRPAHLVLSEHAVERLAMCATPVEIDEYDLAAVLSDEQCESRRHAHFAIPDDANSMAAHLRILRWVIRSFFGKQNRMAAPELRLGKMRMFPRLEAIDHERGGKRHAICGIVSCCSGVKGDSAWLMAGRGKWAF